MATTSLWHIKGRLSDLIAYVEDPEKTVPKGTEDFFTVFSYIQNPQKTSDGSFVTAINCLKQTALRQMILTKQRYGKEDHYIAWHGYQSFKPGEVTPERCHEIGVKLAKEMWGGQFQVIVTTHLDKGHLHNHFCFNSVSFRDGRKYNYSKAEQRRLRDISDRLCREYGLSVIEHGRKAPSRPVWLDERNGKPTRYNLMREAMEAALKVSVDGNDLRKASGSRAMNWTPIPPTNTPPCGGSGANRRCGCTGWGRHTTSRPSGNGSRKIASGTPAITVIIGTGPSPSSGSGPDACGWTALSAVCGRLTASVGCTSTTAIAWASCTKTAPADHSPRNCGRSAAAWTPSAGRRS